MVEIKHKKYEAVYIVRPNLDDDAVDQVVVAVEDFVKGAGGIIISSDKKGRRRLAYEVRKMRDGFYVLMRFEAKPDVIASLKRMMMLSENIIRSLIVVAEGVPMESSF